MTTTLEKKQKIDLSMFEKNYQCTIKDFLRWLNKPVSIPDSNEKVVQFAKKINSYLRDLSKTQKHATVNQKRVRLKYFLLSLFPEKKYNSVFYTHISAIFETEVKKYTIQKSLKREKFLKRHEVNELIEKMTPRMSLIVKTLFFTALRINELTNLRHSDLVGDYGNFVKFRIVGKGLKEAEIMLPKSLYNEISNFYQGKVYLFETKTKNKYINTNVYKEIHRQGQKILNKKIGCHTFRHSSIDYHANILKLPITQVSKLARHSDVKTTMQYCHQEASFSDRFDEKGELL